MTMNLIFTLLLNKRENNEITTTNIPIRKSFESAFFPDKKDSQEEVKREMTFPKFNKNIPTTKNRNRTKQIHY